MKRTISFLLSIIMMLTVLSGIEFVYASSWKAGDNVTVTVNNGVLTVSGTGSMYNYKSKEFPELPKWIVNNGYEVGSDGTVSGYNKIVIEKGVTTIGSFAFTGSMSVESVSIPDSVISIGERAFSGCYKLESINLPSSVMALGSCAFSTGIEGLGSSLAEITVDESNRVFTVENGVLYSRLKTIIYKIPPLAKLTVLDTPNTVTTILEEAAVDCKNLTEVNLSPAVTVVGDNAFKDCRNLKKVVVNNDRCDLGVGSIPDNVGLMLYADKDSKAALYTGNNNTKNIQFVPICEHIEVVDEAVAPTCTEPGLTQGSHCSVCKKTIVPQEIVKPTDHKFDAGKVTKQPTCTATGVKTYTCTACKATKTETIPKKAHTYKNYVTKATLTANGKIVNKCSVCGVVKSTTAVPLVRTFTISATNYNYDGKIKTPSVTVKDSKGKVLRKGTDYDVTYSSGRKNVGKYAVKITLKGNYYGTKTLYFNINPKGTTIAKLTPKSKSLTVQWNKQTNQTTGYQIQYSTYSNFKSAKTITMPKSSYYAKSITGLAGNKRYYVRIRTYKTVKFNGKNYNLYSSWSSTKYTTTKK